MHQPKSIFSKSNSKRLRWFIMSLLITVLAFVIIEKNRHLRNSEPFQRATEFIGQENTILKRTGPISGYGIWLTGNIDTKLGIAIFVVKAIGRIETVKIEIKLKRGKFGGWQVEDWHYK
jgi:hypothetical protein